MSRFWLVLGLFCLAWLPEQAWADSRQCLEMIQQAIDQGDAALFEQLVDVKGIGRDGLEAFLEEAARPEIAENLPPIVNLMLSGVKGAGGQFARDAIVGEVCALVHNGIESGAFGGQPGKPLKTQGMLAPLFANASLGRKEIRVIGRESDGRNGPERSFLIHDWGNGNDYPVTASFSQNGDGFCLVKINNFPEIFAQIIAEAAQ